MVFFINANRYITDKYKYRIIALLECNAAFMITRCTLNEASNYIQLIRRIYVLQ